MRTNITIRPKPWWADLPTDVVERARVACVADGMQPDHLTEEDPAFLAGVTDDPSHEPYWTLYVEEKYQP